MTERAVHLPPGAVLSIIEGLRSSVRTLARELGQDLAELLRASVRLLT
jgi:hypothetical protein